MEKLFFKASELVNISKEIANDIFQYNPAFENKEKKALTIIASKSRELSLKYEKLRVEIINIHEKLQLDKHR